MAHVMVEGFPKMAAGRARSSQAAARAAACKIYQSKGGILQLHSAGAVIPKIEKVPKKNAAVKATTLKKKVTKNLAANKKAAIKSLAKKRTITVKEKRERWFDSRVEMLPNDLRYQYDPREFKPFRDGGDEPLLSWQLDEVAERMKTEPPKEGGEDVGVLEESEVARDPGSDALAL